MAFRTCSLPLARLPRAQTRQLSSRPKPETGLSPNPNPNPSPDIAILGAGITGLTTARLLRNKFPEATITVYESRKTPGGCIGTEKVKFGAGKHVLFETGPRTIRRAPGDPTAVLFHDMDLFQPEAVLVPRTSPAAQNRYVYHSDHIVRMPGPGSGLLSQIRNVISEPLLRKSIWPIITEGWKPKRTGMDGEVLPDESIGDLTTRRLGPDVTNDILSAIFHGIYAGDLHQLSANALTPGLVAREGLFGSLTESQLRPIKVISTSDLWTVECLRRANIFNPPVSFQLRDRMVSTWSCRSGMGTAIGKMARKLENKHKIRFAYGNRVEKIQASGDKIQFKATTGSATVNIEADYVVSTIPARQLAAITSKDGKMTLPSLSQIESVAVGVVNLFFERNVLPAQGFGYLIPQTVPFEQNPDFALGVLFDSYATPGMLDIKHTKHGSKVTVMLGGHWWDGWPSLPSEEELREMAVSTLHRHLNIEDQPVASHVKVWRDGIPQYKVGHVDRLEQAHYDLHAHFQGRLKVAGQSYKGVGVNACVASAASVSVDLDKVSWEEQTGLDLIRTWFSVKVMPI